MLDSYLQFMQKFNISEDEFIQFGIENIIYVKVDTETNRRKFEEDWNNLKKSILTPNVDEPQDVFIRGYGREAAGTDLYISMYKEIFGHDNFMKDGTNNDVPTKKIKRLTGYAKNVKTEKKYERIQNFQVSHVFERTKNPFAFSAPWNIVYLPKIVDPFTGHESHGKLKSKFIKRFQEHIYNIYQEYINDFNKFAKELKPDLDDYLKNIDNDQFKKDVLKQFEEIKL